MDFTLDMEKAMRYYSTAGGFLTVKAGDEVNTMTAAWGFIGFLWNKPYFISFIRPQCYTKKLIDKSDSFTISIPFGTMWEELSVCGTKSGADFDKSKVVSFLAPRSVSSPIVGGCDLYYECKIRYADGLEGEKLPKDVLSKLYRNDFHDMYFGEIVECYK